MLPSNPNNQLDEEFYFINDPDKFFSFQLIQIPSLSIFMIEGVLQNGKEDTSITQIVTKEMTSMNEAIAFVVQLVHQKTVEGYTLLDASKRSQYKELGIKKENISEPPLEISFTPSEELLSACDVPNKSPSSQSEYLSVIDNVSRSEGKTISDEYELIEEYKDQHSEPANGPIIEVNIPSPSELLVEKTFKITNLHQKDVELVMSKAIEYDLKPQLTSDSIQVIGRQSSLFEFLDWLYESLNVSINEQKQKTCVAKVSVSTFHRVNKEDILKKAEELNITCDFRYYMMLIAGPSQSVNEFKDYLYQVERTTKKALYPKYWDSQDTNMYSEIEVAPDCEEFKEMTSLMTRSVPRADITRLVRIQNNYLMDHYLTNINMRQELRNENINRKLLFHGTKQVDPSVIYKSFDTGFDILYAKDSAMFGKGLYFAQNAAYSTAFAFPANIKEAKYQLILADVFVGKTHYDTNKPIKPPEGYDSVCSGRDFYTIFNNFHSYPLYLVEYTMRKYTIVPPRPTQIHKLNFTPTTSTNMKYLKPPKPQVSDPKLTPQNDNISNSKVPAPNDGESKRSGRVGHLLDMLTNKVTKIFDNSKLGATALIRIKKDIIEIQTDPSLDFLFVEEPDETDLSKRILCLIGPSYSPYEGGLFKIQITLPDDYPLRPPLVNFRTKIYHPCIDDQGNICLGLLNQWTPIASLKQIALAISALLYDPSLDEHLNAYISSQYQTHRQSFVSQAHSWTQKYAG